MWLGSQDPFLPGGMCKLGTRLTSLFYVFILVFCALGGLKIQSPPPLSFPSCFTTTHHCYGSLWLASLHYLFIESVGCCYFSSCNWITKPLWYDHLLSPLDITSQAPIYYTAHCSYCLWCVYCLSLFGWISLTLPESCFSSNYISWYDHLLSLLSLFWVLGPPMHN